MDYRQHEDNVRKNCSAEVVTTRSEKNQETGGGMSSLKQFAWSIGELVESGIKKKINSARLVIDLSWAIDLESVIRRRLTRAGADDACGMQGCRNLLDPEERAAQAWWGAADG